MQTPITYAKLKGITNVNSIENPSVFKFKYKQCIDICSSSGVDVILCWFYWLRMEHVF